MKRWRPKCNIYKILKQTFIFVFACSLCFESDCKRNSKWRKLNNCFTNSFLTNLSEIHWGRYRRFTILNLFRPFHSLTLHSWKLFSLNIWWRCKRHFKWPSRLAKPDLIMYPLKLRLIKDKLDIHLFGFCKLIIFICCLGKCC